MPDWIITIIHEYVLSRPTFGLIIIVLLVYHYLYITKLNRYYSVGACRGNPAHCKYDIYKDQLSVIDVRFDAMVMGVYLRWKDDFEKYVDKENIHLSFMEKERIFKQIKTVIFYCFIQGKDMLRRSALENHIPDSGSAEFTRYITEKFDYVWKSFWAEYGNVYDEILFKMPLKTRYEILESRKSDFIKALEEMYRVMNDKKYAIVETNKRIQGEIFKKKGDKDEI